jgi:hypothetical protein
MHFGIAQTFSMLIEEVSENYGIVKEAVMQATCEDRDGF